MANIDPDYELTKVALTLQELMNTEVDSYGSAVSENRAFRQGTANQSRNSVWRFLEESFKSGKKTLFNYETFDAVQAKNVIGEMLHEAATGNYVFTEEQKLHLTPMARLLIKIENINPETLARQLMSDPTHFGKHTQILIREMQDKMIACLEEAVDLEYAHRDPSQQTRVPVNDHITLRPGNGSNQQTDFTDNNRGNFDQSSPVESGQIVAGSRDNNRKPKHKISKFAQENMSLQVRAELNEMIKKINGEQGTKGVTGKGKRNRIGLQKAKYDVDTKIEIFNKCVENSISGAAEEKHRIDKSAIYDLAEERVKMELEADADKGGITGKNVNKRLINDNIFAKHLAAVFKEVVEQRISEIATNQLTPNQKENVVIRDVKRIDGDELVGVCVPLKMWNLEKLQPIDVNALHEQNREKYESKVVALVAGRKADVMKEMKTTGASENRHIITIIEMLHDVKENGSSDGKEHATKILHAIEADPYDRKHRFENISGTEREWLVQTMYNYAGNAYNQAGVKFGNDVGSIDADAIAAKAKHVERFNIINNVKSIASAAVQSVIPLGGAKMDEPELIRGIAALNDSYDKYKQANPNNALGISCFEGFLHSAIKILDGGQRVNELINKIGTLAFKPEECCIDGQRDSRMPQEFSIIGNGLMNKPPVVGQKIPGTDIKATQADVRNYHLACALRASDAIVEPKGFGPAKSLLGSGVDLAARALPIFAALQKFKFEKTHLKAPKPNNQQRNRSGRGQ